MANINGYLMGSNTISTPNVRPVSYTGFKFNGGYILDSVYISTESKTDTEINNISVSTLPDWTPDITFLASMNHTVDGSNVTGLTSSPTKWSLYRHELNSDVQYKVCDVTPDITEWVDYKCAGNKEYEYILYAENNTQISNAIVTDSIIPDFYGCFLIDATAIDNMDVNSNDNVELYKLDLNIKSDKTINNANIVYLQNYTQYDSVVMFKRNFYSGSATGTFIPMDDNGNYLFEDVSTWNDYKDNFRAFINNGRQKYLKLRDGTVYKILTSSPSNNSESMEWQANDSVGQQPYDVTFLWSECASVENNNSTSANINN